MLTPLKYQEKYKSCLERFRSKGKILDWCIVSIDAHTARLCFLSASDVVDQVFKRMSAQSAKLFWTIQPRS